MALVFAAALVSGVLWIPWGLSARSAVSTGSPAWLGWFGFGALGTLGIATAVGAVLGGRGRRGVKHGAAAGALMVALAWSLFGLPSSILAAMHEAWGAMAAGVYGPRVLVRAMVYGV